jgi:hypothetical protein
VVFEPIDGRRDLISGQIGGASQRVLANAVLFEVGAVIDQPIGDAICVLLDFDLITVCHGYSSKPPRVRGRFSQASGRHCITGMSQQKSGKKLWRGLDRELVTFDPSPECRSYCLVVPEH